MQAMRRFHRSLRVCLIACFAALLPTSLLATGAPASVNVTATPECIKANGYSVAELTADVRDSSNMPVDDGTEVSWEATYGILNSLTSTTTGGIARVRLRAAFTPGNSEVTATAGSVSHAQSVRMAGPPASVRFNSWHHNYYLLADGISKVGLQVAVHDSAGNPVADGTVVDFAVSGSGAVQKRATTVGGYATTTVTAPSSAGRAAITASSGPPSDVMMMDFAGDGEWIPSLGADPVSIPADGASKSIIRGLLLHDTEINSSSPDATSLTFSTDSGHIEASGLTIAGTAYTVLTADDTPGKANITLTHGTQTMTSHVVFSGPPAAVAVSPSSLTIPAGADNGSRVSAGVTDSLGNPVADGTVVEFSIDKGSIDSRGAVKDGEAIANVFAADTVGTATVTATCGSAMGTLEVYFSGAPDAILVFPDLNSVPIGTGCRFGIKVLDDGWRPVADHTLVTVTSSLGSVSASLGTRDTGQATGVVYSETAGVATITVTSGAATGSCTITFAGPPSSGSVAAATSVLPADGTSQTLVTATILDSNSNPVPDGTAVTLETDQGSIQQNVTTTNGRATSILTSGTQAGTATISIRSGAVHQFTTIEFQ